MKLFCLFLTACALISAQAETYRFARLGGEGGALVHADVTPATTPYVFGGVFGGGVTAFGLGTGLSITNGVINAGGGAPAFADITSKPTTLSGYGITDAITAASAASMYVPLTRTINGSALSGNITISSITGNAGTATSLQTARTINGVAFDGSAGITITAAAGTLSGTTLSANVVNAAITQLSALTSNGVVTTIGGSGTLRVTGTSTGFGGGDDQGKIVQYGTSGSLGASATIGVIALDSQQSAQLFPYGLRFQQVGGSAFAYDVGFTVPTADRSIHFPDASGDVVTTGDTGTVTNAMLAGGIDIAKLSIGGTPDGTKYLRDDGLWQPVAGDGGGGSAWVSKAENYTAMPGDMIIVDTRGGSFTVKMPATPNAGDVIWLADFAATDGGSFWAGHSPALDGNGHNINGVSNLSFAGGNGGSLIRLTYSGEEWRMYGYIDSAYAATNTAVGLKAPIDSPSFTGVPTAPTPAAADNSTTLATTAYVDTHTIETFPASDVTTGNASISQHGLMPKLPNDATLYPDGVGGWSAPFGRESGWVAPASAGDKTLSTADYSPPDFFAVDPGSVGLNALAAQVQLLTKKVQALETALRAGNIPEP